MSSGLYVSPIVVERYSGAVAAGNLAQPFVAPADFDVLGLVAILGTAPGAGDSVSVNISNSPTSQLANVAPYDLWSALAVPTISGTNTHSFTTSTTDTVVDNRPYALDYPFPGPAGVSGHETAQSTSLTTQAPVTAPPQISEYDMGALVGPDNTYSDFNGVTQSAALVHAGDILTFVVSGTVGTAADLAVVLLLDKR